MSPYRERILRIQRVFDRGLARYVPGADIHGTDLYEFPLEPKLTPPLHCMLCGDGFASDAAWERHIVSSHVSMAEYRKRVLFKYEERGPQAVTPSEKRNMVQNFAHFQQYSHPERHREAQGRGFIHGHCWLRREYGQLGAPATPPGPPPSQPAAPTSGSARAAASSWDPNAQLLTEPACRRNPHGGASQPAAYRRKRHKCIVITIDD